MARQKIEAPLKPIKVRATQMVFNGNIRRRPGTVFTLDSPENFNPKCMEVVDPETPEPLATHPTEAFSRATRPVMDEDNPLGA